MYFVPGKNPPITKSHTSFLSNPNSPVQLPLLSGSPLDSVEQMVLVYNNRYYST